MRGKIMMHLEISYKRYKTALYFANFHKRRKSFFDYTYINKNQDATVR